MLSRKGKNLFYMLCGPLMRMNSFVYRRLRAPRKGIVKVHLGPGQSRYAEGWVNVDANMFTAKCDVWADLRNKLPFPDKTVDIFYSHHVIEHLPDLQVHFDEMFRSLKPGGKIRVGGPNGDSAIKKFIEDDKDWFSNFPQKRESIGGRFENFIFCRGEHLTILTSSFLQEIAIRSGFINCVTRKTKEETGFPSFIDNKILGMEHEATPDCPHTLIIEAIKPDHIERN